jgi:hypothetical protein
MMKKISEKQRMRDEIYDLNRKWKEDVHFFQHWFFGTVLTCVLIVVSTLAMFVHAHVLLHHSQETTAFWENNYNGEAEFCAQEHVKYIEMRDYSYKLEKALDKCEKDDR